MQKGRFEMGKRVRFLGLLAAVAGLFSLVACGGGGGGGSTKPVNGALVVLPGSPSIPVGQSVQFTAYLGDTATSSTWTASGGTISSTGLFEAPSSPGSITITATAGSNGGTTSVQVVAAQPITVTPAALTIPAGGLQTFSSTATGVTWSVNGGIGNCLAPSPGATGQCYGIIDANGNYQAPLAPPNGGSVTITATGAAGSGTAAATILFSSASLTADGSTGQYVIAFAGIDLNVGYPINVAGNIITSGSAGSTSGTILPQGEIDINSLSYGLASGATVTGGTFQVGPVDGRTTLTLTNSSGSSSGIPSFTLQVTLENSQHAVLIDFDSTSTGSGTLDAQNTAAFSTLNGNFAFDFSGVDTTLFSQTGFIVPVYAAGTFVANGNSIPVNPVNAPTNVQDVVENALQTPLVTNDQSLSGSYTNPDSNGRGTILMNSTPLGTVNFAYYVIDQTHLKIVEIDPSQNLAMFGEVFSAPATPTPLAGPVAMTAGGATQNLGPYVTGAVFTINGTSLTNGALDNNSGVQNQINNIIQSGSVLNNTGTGFVPSRYLISLTTSKGSSTLQFAAYTTTTNPPSAVIIETDTYTAGATGQAYQQTAGGSNTGSFAMNLTGVGSSKSLGTFEQDLTGQIGLVANSTTVTGTVDLNNAGPSTSSIVPNSSSTIWNAPATNGRGTAQWKTSNGATFKLAYYVVNNSTVLLLDTDTNRVAAGILAKQY
jgi:Bacterial Ig-like domain (group 2)